MFLNAMKPKAVLAVLLTMAAVTFGFADSKTYKLKVASTWESTTPVLGDAIKEFKRLAEEMSGGRLEIRVDHPSKHKSPFGILDFVKSGQYDIGHTASYYYKGKDARTMFFTALPFGMTASELRAWYEFGGGKELEAKVYDRYNIKVFNAGDTGTQMGGWFKKEVKSLDDLKGLKVRIPGFGGEVMAKLGVVINTIPIGELYMALEMGTIDSVEWVSPAFDMGLGFHKVAKFYYTGWQEPSGQTQFFVNKKSFEKLPADLRAILEGAMNKVASDLFTKAYYENSEFWNKMKSEFPDIQVKSFPEDVMSALKKATDEILDEEASKDTLFKEILDSQRAFLKKAREWTKISEFSYIEKSSK